MTKLGKMSDKAGCTVTVPSRGGGGLVSTKQPQPFKQPLNWSRRECFS